MQHKSRTLLAEFREKEAQRLREIVHEANNPLSIVHNYLHILELRLQHEPEAVEQISLIASELTRAGNIFSRAREIPEGVELSPPVDADIQSDLELRRWISNFVELHSGYALEHGVKLSEISNFADEVGVADSALSIYVEQGKLSQIVGNLIKNAIEACAIGGFVHVGLNAGVIRSGTAGVEIFVEDNGPGLSDSVLANLTKIKVSTKGGDHAGIGLQLAYRLTDELKGALDVHSQSGKGCRFNLFLPLSGARREDQDSDLITDPTVKEH